MKSTQSFIQSIRVFCRTRKVLATALVFSLVTGSLVLHTPTADPGLQAKNSRKRKSSRRVRYRVRKGDTLSKIARRFRTSTTALARMNRLKPRAVLYAGKVLRIRKASYRRWRAAAPSYKKRTRKRSGRKNIRRRKRGKRYARRRKKDPEYKESRSWTRNGAHTSVLVPYNYKLPKPRSIRFSKKDYRVHMFARRFAQGNAVYLEILPHKGKAFTRHVTFKATFANRKLPLTRTSWGFKGLFPIPPYRKAGKYYLKTVTNLSKQPNYFRVRVARSRYGQYVRRIYLGNYDRKRKKRTRPPTAEEKKRWAEWRQRMRERRKMIKEWAARDKLKKKQVFAVKAPDKLTNRLSHPRGAHRITSKYYLKRIKAPYYRKGGKIRYKRRRSGRHRGVDLRARHGEPIYAMANGKVICAQHMYFEGKFVVIDHGHQMYSAYMHHSKLEVREGQNVRAGQLIGRAGETGYARGAHLHLALWIRGDHVDPLSLLSLPIRN